MVLHVTGGKYAIDTGHRCHTLKAAARDDITVTHLQLPIKDARIGFVPDCDEQAMQGQGACAAVSGGFDHDARHAAVVTGDSLQRVIPLDVDLAFGHLGHQAINQNWFGAEFVATMNHGDFAGNVRQVQRFLHRRVATANHGDFLVLVEKAVACCAG